MFVCAPVGGLRTSGRLTCKRWIPASLLAAVDPGFLFFGPHRYGKIVSTKAILDKTTNKCKGERLCVPTELQSDAPHGTCSLASL